LGRPGGRWMRIVMFVRNDVTVDARVLKEAATLTDAGHDVTIVGTSRPDGRPGVEREQRDGITIVRVPLPNWRRWWRWLRALSRLWSMVRRRRGRGRARGGPGAAVPRPGSERHARGGPRSPAPRWPRRVRQP